MEKTIVTTGKTIELAVEEALTRLGLDRDSVSVTVLAQAKSGFLGFGAQPAKVQVTYEVPDEAPAPKAAPSALSAASRSSKSPAEALRKGVSQPPKAEKAPEAPKAEAPKPTPRLPKPPSPPPRKDAMLLRLPEPPESRGNRRPPRHPRRPRPMRLRPPAAWRRPLSSS